MPISVEKQNEPTSWHGLLNKPLDLRLTAEGSGTLSYSYFDQSTSPSTGAAKGLRRVWTLLDGTGEKTQDGWILSKDAVIQIDLYGAQEGFVKDSLSSLLVSEESTPIFLSEKGEYHFSYTARPRFCGTSHAHAALQYIHDAVSLSSTHSVEVVCP